MTSPISLAADTEELTMEHTEEESTELGRAGASARAEYARRQIKDDARRRAMFGAVRPRGSAHRRSETLHRSLARGAAGEKRVGHCLDFALPFTVEGVVVTWPRALVRVLRAFWPVGPAERRRPRRTGPYAPGGTSHSPTGASPRR